MSDDTNKTTEPIQQIVIEPRQDEGGGLCWTWSAFGDDRMLYHGAGKSLSICLDSMRDYLREEGAAP